MISRGRAVALASVVLTLAPAAAIGAEPPAGVAQEIRRGFFVSTDMGMFMVPFGAQPNGYSDAQAYVQLELGYDIIQQLSVSLSFALGAVANACFDAYDPNSGNCGATNKASENFTLSYYQLAVAYNFYRAFERLDFSVKAVVGYAMAAPSPLEVVNGNLVTQLGGISLGAGLGAEYATNLDHFAIGLDVVARFVIGPNISSLAIFPRVKYTF